MRKSIRQGIAALAAAVLAGCATPNQGGRGTDLAERASIAVIERGWHSDIGLPVDQISGPLADLAGPYPGARFLVFGFGDKAFYRSRQETLGDMLKALFPGPGVVLLTVLGAPPESAFGADHVVELFLTRRGLDQVAGFVWETLQKDSAGAPIRLGDGPYPGSAFYASGRTYDGFDNCNAWAATALRRGGLPVDPRGVLFSGQVMAQAHRLASRENARDLMPQ